jgi:hypothetical protein
MIFIKLFKVLADFTPVHKIPEIVYIRTFVALIFVEVSMFPKV